MRAPWALVLLMCCATREPVVVEPEPAQRSDHVDLIVAAIDAYLMEDFALVDAKCTEVLRLYPGDPLAPDMLYESRIFQHATSGNYIEERKRLYRQIRDGLRPPAPP